MHHWLVLCLQGLAAFLKAIGYLIPLMDNLSANYYTREVMLILIREFQSPDEEMKKIVLKVSITTNLLGHGMHCTQGHAGRSSSDLTVAQDGLPGHNMFMLIQHWSAQLLDGCSDPSSSSCDPGLSFTLPQYCHSCHPSTVTHNTPVRSFIHANPVLSLMTPQCCHS